MYNSVFKGDFFFSRSFLLYLFNCQIYRWPFVQKFPNLVDSGKILLELNVLTGIIPRALNLAGRGRGGVGWGGARRERLLRLGINK